MLHLPILKLFLKLFIFLIYIINNILLKVANIVVYDADFLNDEFKKIWCEINFHNIF